MKPNFEKNVFIFIQIKLYVQKIQYIPVDGDICSTFENSFSANFWFIIAQHHSRKSKMDENGKKCKVNFLPVFQNFTNGFSLGSYDGLQQWISFTNEQARFWMNLNNFSAFSFWKSKFMPIFQISEFIRRELIYLHVYLCFYSRQDFRTSMKWDPILNQKACLGQFFLHFGPCWRSLDLKYLL